MDISINIMWLHEKSNLYCFTKNMIYTENVFEEKVEDTIEVLRNPEI